MTTLYPRRELEKDLTHIPFTYKIFPDDFPSGTIFPKKYKPRKFQPTHFTVYYKMPSYDDHDEYKDRDIKYIIVFKCDRILQNFYIYLSPSRDDVLCEINKRLEKVRFDNK